MTAPVVRGARPVGPRRARGGQDLRQRRAETTARPPGHPPRPRTIYRVRSAADAAASNDLTGPDPPNRPRRRSPRRREEPRTATSLPRSADEQADNHFSYRRDFNHSPRVAYTEVLHRPSPSTASSTSTAGPEGHRRNGKVDDHRTLRSGPTSEQGATAAAFWRRAEAWFAARGVVVERVLTDNHFSYRGRLFNQALAEHRILHKYCRPYRPQTNGKVERFHRTLLEEWAYVRPYAARPFAPVPLPAGSTATTIIGCTPRSVVLRSAASPTSLENTASGAIASPSAGAQRSI